jgi:hypothetical protein
VTVNEVVERDLDKSLISDVAMEIGKEMVAYLEVQYPEVYAAMNSGCKLAIRNHIHNDIMWAIKHRSEKEYRDWIDVRKKRRRDWLKSWRAIRKGRPSTTKTGGE